MSAGICIMNKNAVALAADSAATIGQHVAIRNSANKLFALSRYAPVGVIIYANADLMRIPVEIIIKEYKNQLSQKPYQTLGEYVSDFLSYIENNAQLFHLANNEHSYVEDVCANILGGMQNDLQNMLNAESTKAGRLLTTEEQENVAYKAVEQTLQFIDLQQSLLNSEFEAYILNTYSNWIEAYIANKFPWVPNELRESLKQKLCSAFDKDFFRNGYVGLAIAGYGLLDIFPQMRHLHIGGVLNGKIRYKQVQEDAITEDHAASMAPLAQTDVMQTFLFGINDGFIRDIGNAIPMEIDEHFARMDDSLFANSKKDEVRKQLSHMTSNILKKLSIKAHQEYMIPILQSVATLPIEELALLAESMINITSLRRKVAIDGNIGTVGGPIDVAIISKSDGFIWLKRKHYFDAKYNPQYMMTHYGCGRMSFSGGENDE